MTGTNVRFGPISVSFSDDEFCSHVLESIFGDLNERVPQADVQIKSYDWRTIDTLTKGEIKANDDISIDDGGAHYVDKIRSLNPLIQQIADRIGQFGYYLEIEGWGTESLSLTVYYDGTVFEEQWKSIRYVYKFHNREAATYKDTLAKNFVYGILEPLLQAWLIDQNASFLHAASMSIDGSGIVLTGQGGTGKTSATTTLVRDSDDIKFLSDDLALISNKGKIYNYNKSSVIYAYNTEGDALSESSILNGPLDRYHWYWRKWRYGSKGVRRRIPPGQLFDGDVGRSAHYDAETAIYLSRENRGQLDHEQINPNEVARRSTAVILNELDWLIEYSSAVTSAGSNTVTPQKIIEQTEAVYKDFFRDTDTVLLRIPMESGPQELADYIRTNII